MLESLYQKEISTQVFYPVNIAKFLRTPILKNIFQRLFLTKPIRHNGNMAMAAMNQRLTNAILLFPYFQKVNLVKCPVNSLLLEITSRSEKTGGDHILFARKCPLQCLKSGKKSYGDTI